MNYYERHIGDYLKDTTHLSLLEHGVYTRLLDLYYTKEAPIARDQAARLIGARSTEELQALNAVLTEFFEDREGSLHQRRCDVEIAKFKDKQSKAKASANARWSRQLSDPGRNANASTTALRTHSEGNATRARPQAPDTRHQTPNTVDPPASRVPPAFAGDPLDGLQTKAPVSPAGVEPKRQKLSRPLKRCPDAFVVTDEMRAWASTATPGVDLDAETAKFRDHEFAKGRSDWLATWRNWIREAMERKASRVSRPSARTSNVVDISKNRSEDYEEVPT